MKTHYMGGFPSDITRRYFKLAPACGAVNHWVSVSTFDDSAPTCIRCQRMQEAGSAPFADRRQLAAQAKL